METSFSDSEQLSNELFLFVIVLSYRLTFMRAHVRAYVAVHVRVEALVDSHRVRIKQQWHGGELDNGEHDEIGPSGRQGGACIAFEHWRENGECAGLCAN